MSDQVQNKDVEVVEDAEVGLRWLEDQLKENQAFTAWMAEEAPRTLQQAVAWLKENLDEAQMEALTEAVEESSPDDLPDGPFNYLTEQLSGEEDDTAE
jgi:hypothetical protein